MVRLSWTQPICGQCFEKHYPDVDHPSRLLSPEKERCSFCGWETLSGLYVRHDPTTLPFPAEKED